MSTPASSGSGPVPALQERLCAHCGASLAASARICDRCGQAVIKDFFISYNHADQDWAEWIAWQLEQAGYTTLIQAWDFRPGSDFILEMDTAAKTTRRTLAVLSPDYLNSLYTRPEWADALRRDPTGAKRLLLPVRVRDCDMAGLLAGRVYVDLLGLEPDEARERLLAGVREDGRPATAPAFPLTTTAPTFPAPLVAIWSVPYRPNPYFIGREAELDHLHATFAAGQGIVIQALTGLGGLGKTQTATEYVFRYQRDYQAICWVQAETRELLIGDVVKLAEKLQLPEREAQEQDVILAAVRRWLGEHPGWLLILDNVEDARLVQELLPTQGQGHALLTARAQALPGVAQRTALTTLPRRAAVLFLLRRAGLLTLKADLAAAPADQQAQARAIAETLGHLPLALDQAGAYIDETGCGLAGYLALYKKQRAALLRRRGTDAQGHPDPVAVTWNLAFQKVKKASPAAADLLRLCAFLYPEAIPEDLFRDGAKELPAVLQKAATDGLLWNDTLAALRRYSLLDRQAEAQTLSIHRLVQVVLRDALPPDQQLAWAERTVRLVDAAFPYPEFANWKRCQQLLPHALTCASHIGEWQMAFPEAARLLNQAGYYLKQHAQYVEALPLYQQALKIFEQALGPVHPSVAASLNNLAELYYAQGQYAEALPLLQRALNIFEQALGPDHPDVAANLNSLAAFYNNRGLYAEALPLLQRALAIFEQALGPEHPHVATTLNNLAAIYYAQRQYEEALGCFKRVVQIRESTLAPNHPLVASDLNNIATIYYAQRRYKDALPLLKRALAIKEQVLGSDHPSIATSLNNLANLYRTQGQYTEALPLLQRALEIDEQVHGPNHPDVANSLNNLASLYNDQGQYAEALSRYQRALAIWEQALGPDHPNVATCLENLAHLFSKMGQVKQARAFFQRARTIRAKRREAGK